MQTSVDLSDDQLRALGVLAKSANQPLDVLVQQAVDDYLAKKREEHKKILEASFGLWGKGEDGLTYQEKLRAEW